MGRSHGRRGRRTRARIPSWQSARAGRIVSAGIATEAANVATSLVKLHPADAPQEQLHPSFVATDVARRPSRGYVTRTAASHEATTLEPGVAAAARVEPTPAKIGPTEPAEIEIATGVITSAGVVAGEAYVAAAGG